MVRGRGRGRGRDGGGRVSSECVTVLKGVVAEQLIIMLGPRGALPTLGAEKTYTWTTRSGFSSLKAT